MFPPETFLSKDGNMIKVRLASPADYDDGISTFEKVAAEKIYLNTETVSPNIKEVWAERWVNNGEKTLFALAELNGRTVGGIVLTMYSNSPKTDHVRDLGMWIIKEYRGNGIGRALMDYSINWARSNGKIKKILLGVWSTNTNALKFYLGSGFHIDGSHQNAAKIHDSYVDEILMSLDL